MKKTKISTVEILPEILNAMLKDKVTRGLIEAHGFKFVINRDLAEKYGAKPPLTKAELVAQGQKKRWREHHAEKKSKRIARKASVGSEAK